MATFGLGPSPHRAAKGQISLRRSVWLWKPSRWMGAGWKEWMGYREREDWSQKLEKLSEMDSITLAPDFLKILNNNKLVLTN